MTTCVGWNDSEVQRLAREVAERDLTREELSRVREQVQQPHGRMERLLREIITVITTA